MISLDMHDITQVSIERAEWRGEPSVRDRDVYRITITSAFGGHEHTTRLALFAEPGADIGLNALIPSDDVEIDFASESMMPTEEAAAE